MDDEVLLTLRPNIIKFIKPGLLATSLRPSWLYAAFVAMVLHRKAPPLRAAGD